MLQNTKTRFHKFFYETFRVHSKDEYAELFTRGLNNKDGVNTAYPWLYLRIFAVLAAAFAVYALICSAMPGAGDTETLYFVGGAFMDVAFIVLLYELYPYKDFSFLSLCVICLIGGAAADFISAFFYHFHSFETLINGWKLAVIAGVTEEIAKAVPAVICILLTRKNNPFACFIIGAAVGTWFSITENASYIHTFPINRVIMTAAVRAFGCMFSHAVWTAIICYAFKKFRRALINIKFYAVVIFCMALHFCIDMPLENYAILFTEAAACGLAAFALSVYIIVKERRSAFAQSNEVCAVPALTTEHKYHITLSALGAVTCSLIIALATLFCATSYRPRVFESKEEFIEFAHCGYVFNPNLTRKYDETVTDAYAQYINGELKAAEQRIDEEEFSYVYRYVYDEEEMRYSLTTVAVSIIEDEREKIYILVRRFDNGDELYYFPINKLLPNGEVKYTDGKVIFFERVNIPDATTLALISLTGVSAISWGTVWLVMKRNKKKA